MLGRPVLDSCVYSGPQMWPELAQKSNVAYTSSGPAPSPASHDAYRVSCPPQPHHFTPSKPSAASSIPIPL